MSYFDNFIFFDEVVRITFLFLFVYILLCIYFFPYFFKSCIFLAAFDNIQKLKILLQFKNLVLNIIKKFQIKNVILHLVTFSILLVIIKTKQNFYTEITHYIFSFLCCIDFFIFFLFFLCFVCLYLGYKKINTEQKNILNLKFGKSGLVLFLILEGYFCIGLFFLYPVYKISDFFFSCLFKYLENLYYNKLPKLNLLLAIFVWTLLSILGATNKFQILFEKYSSIGFLLVFFIIIGIYFCLKNNEKISILSKAYLFCINFYIAICIFIVVLIEKTVLGTPYKIVAECMLLKYLEINKEVFFIFFIFIVIGIFFLQTTWDSKEEKTVKLAFYNFLDFIVKNLGYFFFNGFALVRGLTNGIIKTATEETMDLNIETIEKAEETVKIKPLEIVIPKKSYNYMACLADNVVNIRKNKELSIEFRRNFELHKNTNPYFKLLVPDSYQEAESASKYMLSHGNDAILLGNCWPIWLPDNIKNGADGWISHLNMYLQFKTYDKVFVKKLSDDFFKYEKFLRADIFKLAIHFERVADKKGLIEYMKKNPEIARTMILYDSTKIKADPSVMKNAELWIRESNNAENYLEMKKLHHARIIRQMQNIVRRI